MKSVQRFALSVALLSAADSVQAAWYNSSWTYRKPVTLNGGLVPAAQTSFPVLVSLTADADLAAKAQNDGDDLLFTADDGITKLDHEIESFDGATGALVAWVRVPSLASGSNTTLYLYYGNGSATNQQNINGVWTNGFEGVWHLHDDLLDSTANANDGTPAGTSNASPARIADGQAFNGVSDYIQTPSTDLRTPNDFTISTWFRTNDTTAAQILIWEGVGTGNGWGEALSAPPLQPEMQIAIGDILPATTGVSPNYLSFFLGDTDAGTNGSPDVLSVRAPFTDTAGWHHVAVVVSGMSTSPQATLFVDGSLVMSDTGTTARTDRAGWDTALRFGRSGLAERYFNGRLDEPRIAGVSRSSSWIQTEYNNQTNQGVGAGKFILSLGAEQGGGTYAYQRPINIPAANLGPSCSADLLNFPILVDVQGDADLRTVTNGGHVESALGHDIRFIAYDATVCDGLPSCNLDHEIERYAGGSAGATVARSGPWVSQTASGIAASQVVGPYSAPLGSNRLLVFTASVESTDTLTGVTFGGVPMQRAAGIDNFSPALNASVAIYYLADASIPGGSNSFQATFSGSIQKDSVYGWALYTGVHPSTPIVAGGTATTFGTTVGTVTTASYNIAAGGVTVAAAQMGDALSFTSWGALAERVDLGVGTTAGGASDSSAPYGTSGTTTATVTASGTPNRMGLAAVALNPVPASPGGDLVAWVRIPRLSRTSDTTIYMQYGNPGVTGPTENPSGVWDANYRGVFHVHDDFLDSTSNGNDGTNGGSTDATGRVANAQSFDGVDDYVDIGSGASLDNVFASGGTLEAWIRPAGWGEGNFGRILDKSTSIGTANGWAFRIGAANQDVDFEHGFSTTNGIWYVSNGITLSQWQHVVLTYDKSSTANDPVFYVNGQLQSATEASAPSGSAHSDAVSSARIGNLGNDTTRTFDGVIDEVRVSNVVRNACWIETEYANQEPGSTFLDVGGEVPTAVKLIALEASPLSGAVELRWETASEVKNLGFHLYRSESANGSFERITSSLVPGLGSSPAGARYRYLDEGLVNGATYHYLLEDVETTGAATRHGPVAATPEAGLGSSGGNGASGPVITYGEPALNAFHISRRGPRRVLLTLRTEGFYAYPQDDGSLQIEVPGFVDGGGLPVRREWVEALGQAQLRFVRERRVDSLGLDVDGDALEVVASRDGTVRLARRGSASSAELASIVEQSSGRFLVEMTPLRRTDDGLLLTRELEVHLWLRPERTRAQRPRRRSGGVVARLATRDPGLYAVSFESLFGARTRPIESSTLKLSRLGETVPFHLEPELPSFGPGSTLFFLSGGAALSSYDNEAVFELALAPGERMLAETIPPSGETLSAYWHRVDREENRLYPSALVDAEDLWQWDSLFSGTSKSYAFTITSLAGGDASLELHLQGGSDFPAPIDHHVLVRVNGVPLGETSWSAKLPQHLELPVPAGVLHEGPNLLELQNLGDTGADYSVVYLDRFAVHYLRSGPLTRGRFDRDGQTEVERFAYVIDVTQTEPRWVHTSSDLRFPVAHGHTYLAVAPEEVRNPDLRRPARVRWTSTRLQADYVAIGPRAFLDAAQPLLDHRRAQGLTVAAVPVDDLYDAFGFGERRPEAIRDFLDFAYHHWKSPAPRYVLLLGDASYDFKDYLGTGIQNQVPALIVKTRFLWTASDPSFASVDGDDLTPELAIGRLPAASVEEVRTMVGKILDFESSGLSLDGASVLVSDDPDAAGDFDENANVLAKTVLAGRNVKRVSLASLGPTRTTEAIQRAFDDGASTFSYIGHGGIHLWASENVFNTATVAALAPQPQQPVLLTLNCLNGYFHFPFFDSLAESLLKADDKGAIAAFSPSGLSLDAPANELHRALLEQLLSGNHQRIGDAVVAAQRDFASTSVFPELLAIYHLFADPALQIR